MPVPVTYNLRSLTVRKTTTILTAVGIALTVAVLIADLAFVQGLHAAFQHSGDPLQLIILRQGSTAEVSSMIDRDSAQVIAGLPGIARKQQDGAARPLVSPEVSPELVTVVRLQAPASDSTMDVTLRGINATGIGMRTVHLVSGRWFQPGQHEIVIGDALAQRYPTARTGALLRFGSGRWEIVGVMHGDGEAADNEIWADLDQVASDFQRQTYFNSVLVRAASAADLPRLQQALQSDARLNVVALSAQEYYRRQTSAGAPMEFLGIFVSIIMAIGSCFAAMNTMYAAVARRSPEIGTLRVLGFSRGGILLGFLLESLTLSLAGGAAGCLIALPLNGMTTVVGSFATLSQFAFRFRTTPPVLLWGLGFSLIIGLLGGLLPARQAARRTILASLKEV